MSYRTALKHLFAIAVYYSGFLDLVTFIKTGIFRKYDHVILMYHRVLEEPLADMPYVEPGLYVSRETFDRQMAFLARHYTPVSLTELVGQWRGERTRTKKTFAVTFDDGWCDNYSSAFPALKRYQVPATIFLSTEHVGGEKLVWFFRISVLLHDSRLSHDQFFRMLAEVTGDDKYQDAVGGQDIISALKHADYEAVEQLVGKITELSGETFEEYVKEHRMLNWSEIREMMPLVNFQSHGHRHVLLTNLSPDEVDEELNRSRAIIEQNTGRDVFLFAYPNGDYNSDIKTRVKQAGYRAAFTTGDYRVTGEKEDLLALRRMAVHEGRFLGPNRRFSKALFALELSGWLETARRVKGRITGR